MSQEDLDSALTRASLAETGLASAEAEIAAATQRISELEATVATLEQAVSDAEASASAHEAEAEAQLQSARQAVAEATADKEAAETLVAELTLAYSREIEAARGSLARAATAFACAWGRGQATDGRAVGTVTGDAVFQAFAASDELTALTASAEVSTAISIAQTLDQPLYGIDGEEARVTAVGCWQTEDARLNAALYQHQPVLRNAALDAACTAGVENLFEGQFGGLGDFSDTAVFQDWLLRIGHDVAAEYLSTIESRYGSIGTFLAIPPQDLDAEDSRCASIRSLIEPKGSGVWVVGREIKAGTWKAFDEQDCYWARLAENGSIRDNFFGTGLRISVNVAASDGQFEISRCTFYYANP